MQNLNDYDYLISIINYLNINYHLNLKIGNKDFDTMYRWWEKDIPIKIVKRTIDILINTSKREIKSISSLNYRVRKEFENFLTFKIGELNENDNQNKNISKTEEFINKLPKELIELKKNFKEYYKTKDMEIKKEIENKLLEKFSGDNELKLNTEIFLSRISRSLINEELVNRYKINFLINKLGIPEF